MQLAMLLITTLGQNLPLRSALTLGMIEASSPCPNQCSCPLILSVTFGMLFLMFAHVQPKKPKIERTCEAKSGLYRWNPSRGQFEEHGEVTTFGAFEWDLFDADGAHYLIVTNDCDDKDKNGRSRLYAWQDCADPGFATTVAPETAVTTTVPYVCGAQSDKHQDIPAPAAKDIEMFMIGAERYFVTANRYSGGGAPHVYKWDSELQRLILQQNLNEKDLFPRLGKSQACTVLTVGRVVYLLVSLRDGGDTAILYRRSADSDRFEKLHAFGNYGKIDPLQHTASHGGNGMASMTIDGAHYFATSYLTDSANQHGAVLVMKLNETAGELTYHQSLLAYRPSGLKAFEMSGHRWLAVSTTMTGHHGSSNDWSYLYRWEAHLAQFILYQRLPTRYCWSWSYFVMGDVGYLAAANRYKSPRSYLTPVDSTIFRWDIEQKRFERFQDIPTLGAKAWKHFEIQQVHYLVVANSEWNDRSKTPRILTSNIDSDMFRFNPEIGQFEEFSSVRTFGATDWEHFSDGGKDWLVVTNQYKDEERMAPDRKTYSRMAPLSALYQWEPCGAASFATSIAPETAPTTTAPYTCRMENTLNEEIPTPGTNDWEIISIGDERYFVAGGGDAFKGSPRIFRWDRKLRKMVLHQFLRPGRWPQDGGVFGDERYWMNLPALWPYRGVSGALSHFFMSGTVFLLAAVSGQEVAGDHTFVMYKWIKATAQFAPVQAVQKDQTSPLRIPRAPASIEAFKIADAQYVAAAIGHDQTVTVIKAEARNCSNERYIQRAVGNCAGVRYSFIETRDECLAAAASLGATGTSAGDNTLESNPLGCYKNTDTNQLYFGNVGEKDSASTDRVSICRCEGEDVALTEYQNLAAMYPTDVRHFEMLGYHWLAVANTQIEHSYLYRFEEHLAQFVLHQRLATREPRAFEYFHINGEDFLAVANYGITTNSVIFRWGGDAELFEVYQEIPTSGARDWTHFEVGTAHYLIVANHYGRDRGGSGTHDLDSVLYRWNPYLRSFEPFSLVETYGATTWDHVVLDGARYLLVGQRYKDKDLVPPSAMYEWEDCDDPDFATTTLEPSATTTTAPAESSCAFQEVPTNVALDFESFEAGSKRYFAVASGDNKKGEHFDPMIMRWDPVLTKPVLHQSINDNSGTSSDWLHFEVGGADYLLLCLHQKGRDSEVVMVYQWDEQAELLVRLESMTIRDRGDDPLNVQYPRRATAFGVSGAQYVAVAHRNEVKVMKFVARTGCSSERYILQSVGNCAGSGTSFIEDRDDCLAAAASLDLGGSAGDNALESNPFGCYIKKDTKQLYFGKVGDKANSGTTRVSICRCEGDDVAFVQHQDLRINNPTDVEAVAHGGAQWLAVAAEGSDSFVYRWDLETSKFELSQSFPSKRAKAFESFVLDDEPYLALANYDDQSNVESVIYRWSKADAEFVELQKLTTASAYDFTHFVVNKTDFLALANSDPTGLGEESIVYKWNRLHNLFDEYRWIPAGGVVKWTHFAENGVDYLISSNGHNKGPYGHNHAALYPWMCEWDMKNTTTRTTTTRTTTTTTTITTTTITTTTLGGPGARCDLNVPEKCASGMCGGRHCCVTAGLLDANGELCQHCRADSGACYEPLAVTASWKHRVSSSLLTKERGYRRLYQTGDVYELEGPGDMILSTDLNNVATGVENVEFHVYFGATDEIAIGDRPSDAVRLPQRSPPWTKADPKNVFVNSNSGSVFMSPELLGNYTLWIVAVDQGARAQLTASGYTSFIDTSPGAWAYPALDTVVMARWDFAVDGQELSLAIIESVRVKRHGVDYTDPGSSDPFIVGESYRFAPLTLDENKTTVSIGTFAEISYTLSDDAPPSFLVQAKSGEIFGQFDQPGDVEFALQAQDRSGSKKDVERMRFDVVAPQIFSLSLDPEQRIASGPEFVDPAAPQSYYPKIPYKIAPKMVDRLQTVVSSGSADDISYLLSAEAPATFFVQGKSGVVFGTFNQTGRYMFSLVARDAGGQTAVVENFEFDVTDQPRFATGPTWSPETDMTEMILPSYVQHTTYTIPGPPTAKRELFVNVDGEHAAVAFKLSFSPESPGNFLVDTDTGDMLAAPSKVGSYAARLIAVDSSGAEATVRAWAFEVIAKPEFKLSAGWNPTSMSENIRAQYRLNEAYDIPGPTATKAELFVGATGGDPFTVTYALKVLNQKSGAELLCPSDSCPGKFFVSTAGEMSIKTQIEGSYEVQLVAQDQSGAVVAVRSWKFEALPEDTLDASNGPNGKGCGPGKAVDELEFDKQFSCDCSATKFAGDNCEEPTAAAATESDDAGPGWVLPVVLVVVFVLIALVVLAGYKHHQYKLKMAAFDFKAECERMRDAGDTEIDAEKVPREIKRSCVSKIDVIGAGAFGEVWKGLLDESHEKGGVPGYLVAIKTSKSKEGEGAEEMLREAALMAQIDSHRNLVSLIGVVTSGEPLLLLLSYCENGALTSVLKQRKAAAEPVPIWRKLRMSVDIATGMAHLAAHNFIHRDLAARNVLVDSTDTCKVADFGLSRGASVSQQDAQGEEVAYYRSHGGAFPVRWTAPEAMETMRFAEATDVWSFGIVQLELYTDAAKPYEDMDNAQVITKVLAGYRHPKPAGCPVEVYVVMLKCWSKTETDRPTFAELIGLLEAVIAANSVHQPPIGGHSRSGGALANQMYSTGAGAGSEEEEAGYLDRAPSADYQRATGAVSAPSVTTEPGYLDRAPTADYQMATAPTLPASDDSYLQVSARPPRHLNGVAAALNN